MARRIEEKKVEPEEEHRILDQIGALLNSARNYLEMGMLGKTAEEIEEANKVSEPLIRSAEGLKGTLASARAHILSAQKAASRSEIDGHIAHLNLLLPHGMKQVNELYFSSSS